MTVRELLDQSHAAHTAYRDAVTRGDADLRRTSLQAAYDTRTAAAAADPTFTDAAWAEESGAYPHVSLLIFYRQELAK